MSPGLVQRCVVIQRDENGFGLTVSGDNPVFVQSVKEGESIPQTCQLPLGILDMAMGCSRELPNSSQLGWLQRGEGCARAGSLFL